MFMASRAIYGMAAVKFGWQWGCLFAHRLAPRGSERGLLDMVRHPGTISDGAVERRQPFAPSGSVRSELSSDVYSTAGRTKATPRLTRINAYALAIWPHEKLPLHKYRTVVVGALKSKSWDCGATGSYKTT